ncbi:MAG: GtrA family protein [Alphaproteobacteria bacterium]|nr:GtrA family protein [Alphaproteobacteria bacterium]
MIGLYLKIYRWWMRWPQKIRFLLVGGYNTVFSYLLFASLLWLFNGQYEQLVLALSFAISSINSFWTQKIYVFGSKAPAWPEFVKCLGTWGISYGLNAALLWGFVDGIGIDAYIAQIIILVILTIFSWIMLKHFAFRNKIEKTL